MRPAPLIATIVATATAALAAAGCGGGDEKGAKAPLGTPERPVVAQAQGADGKPAAADNGRLNEGAAAASGTKAPGYDTLLKRQTTSPRSTFTPCNLVSKTQARTIMRQPIKAPFEAPQGPTCIYRTTKGNHFVTLSVQAGKLDTLRRRLKGAKAVAVADRSAVCGSYGHPMLYLPLSEAQVLAIAAPCPTARRFATYAVRQLGR